MTLQIEGTNIAPRARCTQSSTCEWSVSADEAQRAVNGERNGAYSFHTNWEVNPYLLLDFEKVVDFDEIIVFNRIDEITCIPRSRTLCVDISVDGVGWYRVYQGGPNQEDFGGIDGNPLRLDCPGYQTRFVRLQLQETNYLHLDSVEIYKR
jgi:beta-1,4-mannosyl-glycoprotein beta-1,4-N-acetylglucosaminyltransferase